MALFGYATPVIGAARSPLTGATLKPVIDPSNPINAALNNFYRRLDWPADRAHVETRYERLMMDVFSLQNHDIQSLTGWREERLTTLSYDWPLENFVQYLSTWSGYRRLLAGDASNKSFLQNFTEAAKSELPAAETLCVDFDIFAVFYKKDH